MLVRPGLYGESVRVTRDLTLCGLGPRGSVVVQPPGFAGVTMCITTPTVSARSRSLTLTCTLTLTCGEC